MYLWYLIYCSVTPSGEMARLLLSGLCNSLLPSKKKVKRPRENFLYFIKSLGDGDR